MFDDEERSAWKKIRASDKLLSEIEVKLDCETRERKSVSYKRLRLISAAAAVLAVLIGLFAYSRRCIVDVYVDNSILVTDSGTELAISTSPMIARRNVTPTCNVVLTLNIDAQTRIIAQNGVLEVLDSSGGVLYSGKEYEAKEQVVLNWTYDAPQDETPLVLVLENSLKEYEIILEHNNETMIRNIKCVEK